MVTRIKLVTRGWEHICGGRGVMSRLCLFGLLYAMWCVTEQTIPKKTFKFTSDYGNSHIITRVLTSNFR